MNIQFFSGMHFCKSKCAAPLLRPNSCKKLTTNFVVGGEIDSESQNFRTVDDAFVYNVDLPVRGHLIQYGQIP